MKRYDADCCGDMNEYVDGPYVRIEDVQALAKEVLPYLEVLFLIRDGEDNEKDRAVLAKLKSLIEAQL